MCHFLRGEICKQADDYIAAILMESQLHIPVVEM